MTAAPAVIELRDIRKTYRMGEVESPVLRGITLTIRQGEFVALVGASGSGKSTLLNILGCLDHATSGSYRLDGVDAGGMTQDQRALLRGRKIGFIFQSFNLLPRTSAMENVELPLLYVTPHGRAERRRLARAALERVGLGERLHHLPSQLSGGQQQRVAIARALVTRPPILLADEPTGNLDSRSGAEVLDMLQSLNREGMTLILVTHDSKVAALAHRRVILQDGVIADIEESGGRP